MSKFSDKFVDGMSLVAEKVDENKFLGAIKDSFTIYMPFVIVGSFMNLFNSDHLPADRLCSGGRQDWHRQWPARCSIGFSGSVRGYAGRHSGKPTVRLPDDF